MTRANGQAAFPRCHGRVDRADGARAFWQNFETRQAGCECTHSPGATPRCLDGAGRNAGCRPASGTIDSSAQALRITLKAPQPRGAIA